MKEMEFVKDLPPPKLFNRRGGRPRAYDHLVVKLMARPGKWLLFREQTTSKPRFFYMAPPNFEWASRNGHFNEAGYWVHDVYVRYVGKRA